MGATSSRAVYDTPEEAAEAEARRARYRKQKLAEEKAAAEAAAEAAKPFTEKYSGFIFDGDFVYFEFLYEITPCILLGAGCMLIIVKSGLLSGRNVLNDMFVDDTVQRLKEKSEKAVKNDGKKESEVTDDDSTNDGDNFKLKKELESKENLSTVTAKSTAKTVSSLSKPAPGLSMQETIELRNARMRNLSLKLDDIQCGRANKEDVITDSDEELLKEEIDRLEKEREEKKKEKKIEKDKRIKFFEKHCEKDGWGKIKDVLTGKDDHLLKPTLTFKFSICFIFFCAFLAFCIFINVMMKFGTASIEEKDFYPTTSTEEIALIKTSASSSASTGAASTATTSTSASDSTNATSSSNVFSGFFNFFFLPSSSSKISSKEDMLIKTIKVRVKEISQGFKNLLQDTKFWQLWEKGQFGEAYSLGKEIVFEYRMFKKRTNNGNGKASESSLNGSGGKYNKSEGSAAATSKSSDSDANADTTEYSPAPFSESFTSIPKSPTSDVKSSSSKVTVTSFSDSLKQMPMFQNIKNNENLEGIEQEAQDLGDLLDSRKGELPKSTSILHTDL